MTAMPDSSWSGYPSSTRCGMPQSQNSWRHLPPVSNQHYFFPSLRVVVQYLQPGPSFSSVRRVGYRTVVVGLVTTSCQDRGNFLETPYPPQLERLLREERNPSLLANHQILHYTIIEKLPKSSHFVPV